MIVPFHGILMAPLYLVLVVVKAVLILILNTKLEEVELCILEQ